MTTPDDIFARKEEDYPFVYKFRLPYIVQPAGEWEHSFASQSWQIVTKHVQLPPLIEIITGIQFNPESRHYLSGEYHLMYVEIATSLEAITKKAYQALSCVYEKRMFNEGKLAGQVAHLLHSYCEWADADIDEVVRAVEARNEVVHHGRRRFDGKVAYKQLGLAVKAIEHIKDRLLVVQEEKD